MGNISSRHKYYQLKTTELKETGFQNFMEVSSKILGAKIEYVSDESFGSASNLITQEVVDKDLILEDNEANTHGWLTKRHEKSASVTITLCNNTKIVGFDVETTGYTECCPSFANIEGFSQIDLQWHQLVPQVPIQPNSHNFFELKTTYSFSSVRLNITPGGGIARFRTYGDVTPEWSDELEVSNLASASLGAQVVRWTDQKSANSKNVLLDDGTTMDDGWLTPRSKMGKDRNDYIVIKLATSGKLNQIVIDTNGFEHNSPSKITIQGCYSNDIDPYYAPTKWITLVSHEDVTPGDYTMFDVETEKVISHIKVFIVPDGGIQQIKVYGTPAQQKKRGFFMIEAKPETKAIENNKENVSTTEAKVIERVEETTTIETEVKLVLKEEESELPSSRKREFSASTESLSSPTKRGRGRPKKEH